MVEVTYHCPYCGAITAIERDAYMADKCVTKDPLEGWEYASTTGDYETADGIEFVCLGGAGEVGARDAGEGDADGGEEDTHPADAGTRDGCGRTFYLSFVRFEGGSEVDPAVGLADYPDAPKFDFLE